jgi:hypothetical protein
MTAGRVASSARGQAIVECVVALLLLVPLWWWLQHWQQGQAQRAALVQQARHVGLQVALGGEPGSAPGEGLRVTRTVGEAPGMAGTLVRGALALIEPVEALAPGSSGLSAAGWTRMSVQAPPPPGRFWREHGGPWDESLTLYAGDWSLARSRAVERRTQALLPTTPLEWAIASLEPLRGAITMLEPAYRSTCARRVDPDVLPVDRLVTAAAASAARVEVAGDGWRPRC